MTRFHYSQEIVRQFPNLAGGIVLASNMKNGPTPEALCREFIAEQQAAAIRIGDRSLSELPSIQAWRRAFSQFGVEPTKYRSATESLLRRLTKKGDIPSINTLVDIGNLISIRYELPVAVCDSRAVQGTVTVHFADGSERYRELGSDEIIHPPAGEVVFSDETGMVVARRWCWRQSAESAAQEDTTAAFITFEAQHEGGLEVVEKARQDLLALLRAYAGGEFESAVLTANQPGI